jgi:hypothetical protein
MALSYCLISLHAIHNVSKVFTNVIRDLVVQVEDIIYNELIFGTGSLQYSSLYDHSLLKTQY